MGEINEYKSYYFVLFLTLNANFGALLFGNLMSVYNPLQDYFAKLYDWNDDSSKDSNNGIITALLPIGGLVGSAFIGTVSGKLGRKNCLLIADILGIIGIGLTMIQALPALYIGRLIAGASIGINSVIIPIYVNEMSPDDIRGRMGTWFQTNINVGFVIGYLWGFGVPTDLGDRDYYWRLMFAFPVIFCILRAIFLILIFNYDTPTSLLRKAEEEEALRVLEKIYHKENCDSVALKLKDSIASSQTTSYSVLFTSRYSKRLFVGIILCLFQQYSGINAVLFYSNDIFKNINGPTIANVLSVVIGLLLTIASFLSGLLIDDSGRKKVFLGGSSSLFLSLFILGFMSRYAINPGTIVFTFIYCFSFGLSLGPIVWLYMPEILPERGVSLSSFSNWVFTAVIGATFPKMKSSELNMEGTFWFFSGCMLVCFFFILAMVKETKDKSTKEIDQMFGYETQEPLLE